MVVAERISAMDDQTNDEPDLESESADNGEDAEFAALVCPGEDAPQTAAKHANAIPKREQYKPLREGYKPQIRRGRPPVPMELIEFVADCLGARMTLSQIKKLVEQILEKEISVSAMSAYAVRARQFLQIRHGRPEARQLEDSIALLERFIRDDTLDARTRMEANRELLTILGMHPGVGKVRAIGSEAPEATAARIRAALAAADASVPEPEEEEEASEA